MFPLSAIWSVSGQERLRSATDVFALCENTEKEFQVFGHFAYPSPPERRKVEIPTKSPEDLEQICRAVKRARSLNYDLMVQPTLSYAIPRA
jgi:hypothetical protein